MARIGNLAAAVGLFGGAVACTLGERNAEAAFTGYTVVATPITNSGQNLVRYEVFANFNGATDTILNVFNFQAQGGWGANLPAASGFWHKDNSDYSGGVLGQEYGTWAPQLTGSATLNRPFDSHLLIGGNAAAANTTNADPSWGLAGAGSLGWNVAQIPVANLTNANALGWFNSSPPNNQGRVGVAPNTATQVKVGQFILLANDQALRTFTLRTAFNNGAGGGTVFVDGSFQLCQNRTWYRDLDGDGFGAATSGTLSQCAQPFGYVLSNTDCNDADASINPNTIWYRDIDGDGFGAAASGTLSQCVQSADYVRNNLDCNDADPSINPYTIWFRDLDGDGFGFAANGTLTQCTQPAGYVLNNTDNCPTNSNPGQEDCDNDGVGDVCDVAFEDCDADGVCDLAEIAAPGGDSNSNGVLDDCERLFGDLNLDGVVTSADLSAFFAQWGSADPEFGDLNLDGMIDGADISILLANWGDGFGAEPFTIAAITPAQGSLTGGTTVSISGTNLSTVTSVTIGGAAATAVTVVSPSTITVVTPPGSYGVQDVVLKAGQRTTVKVDGFAYVLSWATVLEQNPNPAVVTSVTLRNAITATGLPWRVRDNGTDIEMVLIPKGTFSMGCSGSTQYGCDASEGPVHAVTLTNAFYMGRYEVTQAQWQARMGTNPSYFKAIPQNGNTANTNRPVERVSWNQIAGTGGFLTGTGLRLPTEAEWEYAYRAGTATAFHGFTGYLTGTNNDALVGNIGWGLENNGAIDTATYGTKAVGQKLANGFGLHDMSGNVWEWVNDWYSSSYYASSPSTNPTGPTTGTSRSVRGGGWGTDTSGLRASERGLDSPDLEYYGIGFRVARNPQ